MTNDEFLTRRWNNRLLLIMGVPTLAYASLALLGSAISDLVAFVGMAVLGAVY